MFLELWNVKTTNRNSCPVKFLQVLNLTNASRSGVVIVLWRPYISLIIGSTALAFENKLQEIMAYKSLTSVKFDLWALLYGQVQGQHAEGQIWDIS